MIRMSLGEVGVAVEGHLTDRAFAEVVVNGSAHHDSRLVGPGDLFVALPGEHHDGHDFLADVHRRGAAGAIVTKPDALPAGLAGVVVADAERSLGLLAAEARGRLTGATVIAITGSSGKTTSKDLLASVLAEFGPTVAPPGSLNNDIGLPMTVLAADERTRYLVLEMGARAQGDIERLCEKAQPDIGVVLNVGTAHAGEFGSPDAIAAAKGELVAALGPSGTAILNQDDPAVGAMRARAGGRVITFGSSGESDVRWSDVRHDEWARPSFDVAFEGRHAAISLRLPGGHQVTNAVAALTVGLALGLPLAELATGLGRAELTSRWRMEVTRTQSGGVVVNDAYNANPESMSAALRAVGRMSGERELWAVLGEMRELGEMSTHCHEAIGRLAAEVGVGHLVLVGPGADPMAAGARSLAGWRGETVQLADTDAACREVPGAVPPGAVVLVKASRALGLERVAEAVVAAQGGASDPI